MEILKKAQEFIETNQLLSPKERVLVGVSGGADSVVMLNILLKLGYKCVVAHCNFHLRDDESDRDENFVENLTKTYALPYHKIDFDTVRYAKSNKISIEMAARELRYAWFHQIASETQCNAIAVAHHQDDSIETALLNMIRGTGLKGLTGIEPKNGQVVRPLLCCTRSEIEQYAQKHKLHFVTDSTNNTNDYSRNKIRNVLLPQMANINPSIKQTLAENAERLKGAWKIYDEKIKQIEKEIAFEKGNEYLIDIQKLTLQTDIKTVLYELLQPFHFHSDVIADISQNLDKTSGKRFFSDTHRLLKDRDFLIIDKVEKANTASYLIEKEQHEITFPVHLYIKSLEAISDFSPSKKTDKIHVDADKIEFPLMLRKWQEGDWFHPFGMNKSKKLSDFFIDEKLSLNQKEDVWLLVSGKNIVWIIGFRLDNRFKITASTKNILEIHQVK